MTRPGAGTLGEFGRRLAGRASIRLKLYFALGLSAAVMLPVVTLSVWYQNRISAALEDAARRRAQEQAGLALVQASLDPNRVGEVPRLLRQANLAAEPADEHLAQKAARRALEHGETVSARLAEARALAALSQRNLVTLSLITLCAVATMLVLLPRGILRPLSRLQNLIHRARDGDLTVVAPHGGGDEVAEIARALNNLVEQFHREQAMRTARIKLLRRTLEILGGQITEPVCVLDAARQVEYANGRFVRWMQGNRTAAPVEGQPFSSLVDDPAALDLVEELFRGKDAPAQPITFHDAQGARHTGKVLAGLAREETGEVVRLVMVFQTSEAIA